MIEISFGKLVLLALIALIVLGPEKLPGAARTAGALLRRVRNGWDSVRAEVERELEVEEIRRTAREAAAQAEAVQKEVEAGVKQVREPLDEAVATMKSAGAPAVDAASGGAPESPAAPVADAATGADEAQAQLPLGEPAAEPAPQPAAREPESSHGRA
ncbi:Sec-independent protein translocase protein TatB [Rhodanobacter glycinis]|uniref:Sec-independent protein translocase protein TatB n=1 Tax=Rhodanobacter glycinis TaxID=582702 RepID=A0A1I3YZK1_9GAMM|nr:Sec-independent protein translocase protein TatB [Rhodanobacter glycinis]SFK37314.1 Sec-independent protein translocase TatB [Rhodanobacter glycinis]